MNLVILVLLPIAMFLGWAVGGEYRFGMWKRGMLLAIPLTIVALCHRLPWLGLIVQVGLQYVIYQCLFYDDGINMVYEKKDKRGWLIIGLNGVMIGLTGLILALHSHAVTSICIQVIAGVVGFIFVVKLSNDAKYNSWRMWLSKNGKQYIPYTDDKGNKGYYINFKDAWYVSEGLMGAILGIVIAVCLL